MLLSMDTSDEDGWVTDDEFAEDLNPSPTPMPYSDKNCISLQPDLHNSPLLPSCTHSADTNDENSIIFQPSFGLHLGPGWFSC